MKKIISVLLAVITALTIPVAAYAATSLQKGDVGVEVSQLQTWLRRQGYFNYRTTGRFSGLTEEAVRQFQLVNSLPVTGKADSETQKQLYSMKSKKAPKNKLFVPVYGPHTLLPDGYGIMSSWEEINKIFPVSATAEVRDLYSSSIFEVKRTGGENNAEVTPVTQADADEFVSMCGGSSTWEKRPVKVTIAGTTYAGAIFCSLSKTGASDLGETTIYFNGSRSDIFGIKDAEMTTAVMKAGGEIKS